VKGVNSGEKAYLSNVLIKEFHYLYRSDWRERKDAVV
jgi:hypothetical protein